jgi:integrase
MPGRVFMRGDIYWIAFYCKGREYRTSAKTTKKREAETILAFYLGKVARGEFREFERKEMSLSLTELLNDFEEDCKERGLAGYDRIHSHLNPVRAYFKDIAAAQVNERCIDLYRKHRLSMGRTRATINREVQYLSQALKLAVKKKLLTTAPEIEKYQEKNARQGFFEVEDFERVVPLLTEDIQDFVRFGYYSGWRRGEIAQLEWRDVEEEIIRLRPEISKTRDGRILSLVGEIADIIARRRVVQRADVPWVFYRFRKGTFWPVGRFDKVWRKACARAGVAGRLFHDFRRSTVRNMTRAGVPEKIAMDTTGHKTRAIFDRYNITNEADIRAGQLRTQAYLTERRKPPFSAKYGQNADNEKN